MHGLFQIVIRSAINQEIQVVLPRLNRSDIYLEFDLLTPSRSRQTAVALLLAWSDPVKNHLSPRDILSVSVLAI